ncbi:hypothetical protein D3C71_1676880 [compost metagenome]
MFNCTPISIMIELRMTKPKLAPRDCVKTVVCVKKPGPMAEVAIRNAAPISTLLFFMIFIQRNY